MGFNENVVERLVSVSFYLVIVRVGDWFVGSDVCVAYFASYLVIVLSVVGCYRKS